MQPSVRILSIQDSDLQTELLIGALRNSGFNPTYRHITSLNQLRAALTAETWDVVLSSFHTAGCDGLQVLAERTAAKSDIPVIIVDRATTPEEVAGAMRLGAADFITPGNWRVLKESISRELQKRFRSTAGKSDVTGDASEVPLTGLDRERREAELRRLSQALRDEVAIRRQMEDSLRESEGRFRTLADGTPVIIWTTDAAGKNQFVNRAWCNFFGFSEEEARTVDWRTLVHPADVDGYTDPISKAIQTHTGFVAQARVRRHDGQWRWIESHGEPRLSDSGEFLGLAGSTFDVTERRQAEEALRQARQQLETITSSMEAGVTHCSRDLRYLWVSPAYARWANLPAASIIGCPIVEVLGEDGLAGILPYIQKVLAGQPVEYEAQVSFSLLGLRWIHAAYTPTFDAAGEVDGWVAVVTDITDRKHTEEALYLSEEKYAIVHERASVAIALATFPEMQFVEVNPAWLELFEFTREEAIGKTSGDLGMLMDLSSRNAAITVVAEARSLRGYEGRYRTKTGKVVNVLINVELLEMGGNTFALSTVVDITERKRAESALRESEERFRLMADSAPVLIWINGMQGAEFVNRAYREFVGVASDKDIAEYDWAQYVHLDDRKAYLDAYLACFGQQTPFEAVFRFRRCDGEYRWMKSIGQPRFAQTGEFLGYVGCTVDITDVKVQEDAPHASRPMAQQ